MQEELNTCKTLLVKHLEQTLLLLDAYMTSGKKSGWKKETAGFYMRCEKRMRKIREEQLVTENDYSHTFYKDLLVAGIFEGETNWHLILHL